MLEGEVVLVYTTRDVDPVTVAETGGLNGSLAPIAPGVPQGSPSIPSARILGDAGVHRVCRVRAAGALKSPGDAGNAHNSAAE